VIGWRLGIAAALLPLAMAGPAPAQTLGVDTRSPGGKSLPVNISADNGIEWRQADHVYIARGNVRAVRGDITVYADEMRAYYRPVAKKPAPTAAAAPKAAPVKPAAAKKSGGAELNEGATEIYRLDATGNVKFVTKTQTGYGDHADYDVDKTRLVMTGKHLKIVSPRDTLTARDSIEWYDNRQLGVARGDAVDVHDGKHIAADVLVATFTHAPGEEAHISRIDADGNVFVSSKDQIGRGDKGVYDVKSGTVTLTGHVRLTRGQNELRGSYGVVDINRNIGHLLPAPPGQHPTSPLRVEGLIMPQTRPEAGGASPHGRTRPAAKPAAKSARPKRPATAPKTAPGAAPP